MNSKKKKHWIAIPLSVIFPGLGHLYIGKVTHAVIWFISSIILWNIVFFLFLQFEIKPFNIILPLFLCLVFIISVIVNVCKVVTKYNKNQLEEVNKDTSLVIKWYHVLSFIIAGIIIKFFFVPEFGSFESFKIPAVSMEGSLLVGDYFIADLSTYSSKGPERNDVVVFIYPGDMVTKYVKRCVGLPGDTIEIIGKMLYINGVKEKEIPTVKYIDTTSSGELNIQPRRSGGFDTRDNFGPYVVPNDSYFMMGDNRDNSHDSRWWGPVHKDLLVGKGKIIYYSKEFDRIGMKIE